MRTTTRRRSSFSIPRSNGTRRRGPTAEGLGAHLIEWLEPWDEHRIEAEEFIGNGALVFARIHVIARGEHSGMEIDQRFFQVYRVENGRIKRMDEYVTRHEALDAAGLPA